MRTIDEYMKIPYKLELVEDQDEGGYVASFPDLKGCITCAGTVEGAVALAKDAKQEWLAAALEDGYPIPEPETMRLKPERLAIKEKRIKKEI